MLEDIGSEQQAVAIANKIIKQVNRPRQIERFQISVSMSIGLVMSFGKESSIQQLLDQADEAMYQAKLRSCVKNPARV